MLWLLLACATPATDTGPATCEREPPLSWDSFGQQFMHTHCAGCHSSLYPEGMREGATVGVDFDTYEGVLRFAERVAARALDQGDMPPGGGPDELELARLEEWLACQVAADREAWLEEAE